MIETRSAIRVNLLTNRAQRAGVRQMAESATNLAAPAKETSIAERPHAGVPDFRSLGLTIRLLAGCVIGCVFVALAKVPLDAVLSETVALLLVVAPVAFLTIAVLAVLARWVTRWPLPWVIALSLALAGLLTFLVSGMNLNVPTAQAVLIAWVAALIMWAFLALETRAKSPAFDIARLQALQARIRPHFLFNSLNAVASMVRSEPRKAETALMDLADLYRALMKDNRELTLLSEEVTLASQYLTLEKLRLAERLRIKWFTDNMPGDALVPPLVLQPLLENAVYHGIEPSPKGGDIVVNIFARREQLTIVVSNPYLGERNQRRSRGNNMAVGNIRERLKLHFDVEGSMQQTVRADTYEVRVTMPYRKGNLPKPTRPHIR